MAPSILDTEATHTWKRAASLNAVYAYLGAIVTQTGVQMIAPALPAMRDALGLTDVQLGLVSSVYLLPGALAAIPMGMLADRIGRRRVFGGSLLMFGVAGLALQFSAHSFALFLAIRFIQGLAFAGLLPLTMTILGDSFSGPDLIRAQGRRSVAMALGDGALPMIGGALVSLGWFVPWLGQVVAIPFGLVVLARMTDPVSSTATRADRIGLRGFLDLFTSLPVLALQYAGFLRMFLKFGILTFMPVLLVDLRGLSAAFAGLAVGSAAITGTAVAASAGRFAHAAHPARLVALGLGGQAVAVALMALVPLPSMILVASLLYGAADGLAGLFVNSFVTAATGSESLATFVAATGAIRNFAKFMAPAAVGTLTLIVPLGSSFVIIAGLTLMSALLAVPLRPLEARLTAQRGER